MPPATTQIIAPPRRGWPELDPHRAVVMGVLNVTPNSFSDGGHFAETEPAVQRAFELVRLGAAVVDIGGESSHPKAQPVTADEEQARVLPVIRALADVLGAPISIDTYRASTAEAALAAGATIVNDIGGLQQDAEMAGVVAAHGAGVCIMHNRPAPDPDLDVMADMLGYFDTSLDIAARAGIDRSSIVLDPGIGFGKTFDQNLIVLNRLDMLSRFNLPILVGASRKGFIGALTGRTIATERIIGSLAAHVAAVLRGASILRAHDVAETCEAVAVASAVLRQKVG